MSTKTSNTIEEEIPPPSHKPAHAAAPKHAPAKKKLPPIVHRYKKPGLIILGVIAAIACAIYAFDSFTHEETDDAYVTGHVHNVASRINGVVTAVKVDDNQRVNANDVLVTLDPTEYQALEMAATANVENSEANLQRQEPMLAVHAMAPEDVDKTRSTHVVNLAQQKLAQLQIEYSTIHAPADGYIGRKSVEVGNRVSSGQTLLVIVEPELWVVANFKETQLAKMHKGQPATVTIDALPGKVFTGQVDSFSPATGNQFALLPADNSTGNFTKIVQRVPVKITFDRDSVKGYEERIRAGESAIVKIDVTKDGPKDNHEPWTK